MKWIGLTGGIASGKSTVADLLVGLGFAVINADSAAHKALQPESDVFNLIIKKFGKEILNSENQIDRRRLGDIVFLDPSKRLILEQLVHPIVQKIVQAEKYKLESQGTKWAFYDVPLLYEKKLEKNFDAVVLVTCDEAMQRQRLKDRNKLGENDINLRLKSQIALEEKIKKTSYVIYNNGSLEDLKKSTEIIIEKLQKNLPSP